MDRREFLRTTGVAVAATAVATTTASAAERTAPARGSRELRLAVAFPAGHAGPADWASRLARSIGELGAGSFHVTPVFGLADPAAAVRAGDADLCFGAVDTLLDFHRGFAYFAGLPGDQGLSPRDLYTWITVAGGQTLWDDLAADAGLKPMLAAHTGSRSLLLSTRRIDEIGSVAGLKMHVGGLARDVARGLGMETVTATEGKLAHAMQRGDVEVAECGGAIASYAAGLLAVAPYSAGASFNQNGTSMYLGVSRHLWDSLDSARQALIANAASGEFQLSLAEEEAHREMLFPAPQPDSIWPVAAELAHAIERVAAAVVAHTAGTDAKSRRIADSYAAFKRRSPAPGAYA